MSELRRLPPGRLEDQHMLVGIRKMILPADDMTNAKIHVIRARRQVVSRHPVGPQQREVFDIVRGLHLLSINRVRKADRSSRPARYAEPQSEWLSGGRPPVALVPREFTHTRIEEPSLCRPRSLAIARVRRRKVAVGQPLLKDRLRDLPM